MGAAPGGRDVEAFLASAEVTGGLDPRTRGQLVDRLEQVALASGEYLMRQGDAADAMYLVVTGRLRVVAATPDGATVVGQIGPGAVVGELALLADEPRLASVVATRDTELLRLSRDDFEAVVATGPALLRAVATTVVRRLGERGRVAATPQRTVAVMPVTPDAGDDAAAFGQAFAEQLGRLGPTAVVAPPPEPDPDAGTRTRLLQQHEREHRFVVLEGGRNEEWGAWCVRHADAVLLVARAQTPPQAATTATAIAALRADPATAPAVHLVLRHPADQDRPHGSEQWLSRNHVDGIFHVRDGSADVARVARHMAGRAVGVTLGGGGARGFAHLGVLRALDEAKVPIDVIGGTSIGAVIAGFYAMGWSAAEREERAIDALARNGGMFGLTLPVLSLSSATKVHRLLTDDRYFGRRRIEDLWLPFCCISADLGTAEPVVHDRGPVALAVRASISLPGILPPLSTGNRWLVDGGVLDNLPTRTVRARAGGGPLIAVDIRPRIDLSMTPAFGPAVSGWSVVSRRLAGRGTGDHIPSLLDVFVRASGLGSIRAQQAALEEQPADLLLRPPVGNHRILDFRHGPALIRSAYEYTVAALETAPEILWS